MITLFGCAHFFNFVSVLLYPTEVKRLQCAMLGAFTINHGDKKEGDPNFVPRIWNNMAAVASARPYQRANLYVGSLVKGVLWRFCAFLLMAKLTSFVCLIWFFTSHQQSFFLCLLAWSHAIITPGNLSVKQGRVILGRTGHWTFRPITISVHVNFGPSPNRPIQFRPTGITMCNWFVCL